MRIIPIKSINKNAAEPEGFVNFSEEEYRLGVVDAALGVIEANKNGGNKPIVLITGPSGSGKTVTAHRLRAELTKLGAATHIISMDNYFKPLKGGTDGVDLESPDRVDRELFAEQAEKILSGEEITLPIFNFQKQDREWGGKFRRGEGEFVIFEGIHMLNPLVSGCLAGHASSVYVSVRTRLKSALGHSLHPSKIRLMRRFVRDKLFRARTFFQTMEHFNNVQRGEKLHIMPYKKHAEFDIDTFVPYETNVYKKHIFAELAAAPEKNNFVYELLMFLEELENIADEFVPEDSLVREFIGGNTLMY
ncbi:MAG: nucleoside kinase [Oscillospiraceae bacterium]|nr:nucleoside kinase [Oscillospiraceae bacterium]